jgi:hypothetical protein
MRQIGSPNRFIPGLGVLIRSSPLMAATGNWTQSAQTSARFEIEIINFLALATLGTARTITPTSRLAQLKIRLLSNDFSLTTTADVSCTALPWCIVSFAALSGMRQWRDGRIDPKKFCE